MRPGYTPPVPLAPHRRAAVLLGCVAVLAAIEWIAAAFAYRARISLADWQAVAAAVAELPPGEPVVVADDWLSPSARGHVPALTASLGLPDLHGAPRLHVLALGDPQTATVEADLAGLSLEPLGADDLGPFTLYHFSAAGASPVLWDILSAADLAVRDARPCRRTQSSWSCKHGRPAIRFAELGYRPRRCLAVDTADGVTVELSARAELGARLRGHLGFHDFNGRLRDDAPVVLELAIAGTTRARWTITDMQGWTAFELPTTPGPADLTVRITPLLTGTFHPAGYDPDTRRLPCLELRALAEPA